MRQSPTDQRFVIPSAARAHPHPPTDSAEQPAAVPASAERAAPRPRSTFVATLSWVILAIAVLALLGEGITLLVLFGERDYTGRIYPNISIQGVAVGGKRIEAARETLQHHYADFLDAPVTLTYDDRTWHPDARQLGITLDIEGALQQATAIGRSENRATNAQQITTVWDAGTTIPLHLQIDQAAMQRYLLTIAHEIEAPPHSASVVLQGADVQVLPEAFGLQLLVDETMQDMLTGLDSLQPHQVTLRTRMLSPAVREQDAARVASKAKKLLAAPIVLTGTSEKCAEGACSWELLPEQIAGWLRIQQITTPLGNQKLDLVIDQAAMRRALIPIAETMHQAGGLPRVNRNEDGTLTIFRAGTPGQALDTTLALAHLHAALQEQQADKRRVTLARVEVSPRINEANLASLQISEFVGVGISSFRGSEWYRVTNIREGASRMHGILIPPGEEFSFNTMLGPVGAGTGFVQGAAIVQNRIQQEWGGGLCQVSTTMFRAAFWAGLPITERHEHSFRIGWYEELGEPPGFDATIYTGAYDLRFVNDTGDWLLTQTWVDSNRQRLFISLLGPPQQRDVAIGHRVLSWSAPLATPRYIDDPTLPWGTFLQTDWATGGMTVHLYRTVREHGEIIREDTFPTTFKPRADVYVRGTGGW